MSDDIARRDRLVANWATSLKRQGVEFSTDALQRVTANDLRIVDRARADGRMRTKRKPKGKQRPGVARPQLHAEALAAKVGGSFYAKTVADLGPAPREAKLRGLDAERQVAMQRRIKLLTERGAGRCLANETIEKGPWIYPSFAKEIGMTCLAYNMRIGGYRDLSDVDRGRRFFRALQDICDRPDALVGVPWWVK
jgi:hypothetical protein